MEGGATDLRAINLLATYRPLVVEQRNVGSDSVMHDGAAECTSTEHSRVASREGSRAAGPFTQLFPRTRTLGRTCHSWLHDSASAHSLPRLPGPSTWRGNTFRSWSAEHPGLSRACKERPAGAPPMLSPLGSAALLHLAVAPCEARASPALPPTTAGQGWSARMDTYRTQLRRRSNRGRGSGGRDCRLRLYL